MEKRIYITSKVDKKEKENIKRELIKVIFFRFLMIF